MKDPDEITRKLAEEFAVLLNPKTTLTPHLCRKGGTHFDSVGDQKGAEFREFCWKSEERGLLKLNCFTFAYDQPEGKNKYRFNYIRKAYYATIDYLLRYSQ